MKNGIRKKKEAPLLLVDLKHTYFSTLYSFHPKLHIPEKSDHSKRKSSIPISLNFFITFEILEDFFY